MPPDRLGKYELRGTLGKGAMGIVYDAWDPAIERRVAVKTIRLPAAGDEQEEEEYARFKREAQAAGRLSHPGIVGVYDYGDADGIAYIAMELVEGQSLKALLDAEHRLTPEAAVRVMRELLDALAYSHARGVIHRDIKPTNILITPAGALKITDFGIARIESSSMTQMGTVMGTPAYMSPEQFMGQTVDHRTDIYSAGVLLFQLLTGERPFEGGLTAIMHKVLHTEPPKPSDLSVTAPESLDAVVAQAMARRPDDRYPSAQAFSTALSEALSGAGQTGARPGADVASDATIIATARSAPVMATAPATAAARPANGAAASASRTRRAPAGLIGAAAAVVLVLGVGAFLLLRPGAETAPRTASQAAPNMVAAANNPAPAIPVPPIPVPATPVPAVAPAAPAPGGTAAATPPPPVATPVPSPPTPAPSIAATPGAAPPSPAAPSVAPPSVTASRPTGTATIAPIPSEPPVVATPVIVPPVPPASDQRTTALASAATSSIGRPATVPEPDAPSPPAAALRGIACTLLEVGSGADSRAVVTGLAGTGSPEAAARAALAAAGLRPSAVDWRATRFDGPYCSVVDTLRDIRNAQPGASRFSFDLTLRGGRTRLRNGEIMAPAVTAPAVPAYLQLVYFQSDGTAVHLFPTAATAERPLAPGAPVPMGDPRSGGWPVGSPFGTDMMVAIMSSEPLATKLDDQPADAYLATLRRSADHVVGDGGAVAFRAVVIQTTR